jgi:Zn finger protein HypA/HybF involved in hydrogenase expression
VCKKEFEPYNWFIECESCDEGVYESLMFDYGQGSSFIKCPYCKGKGGWDTVEKELCRSCKEYKEYENSDDFEDDNYCPTCGRSDDR